MDRSGIRRRCVPVLLLAMVPMLTGCAVSRLIKQGDAYLAAGSPHQAVQSYHKALSKKSDLAENEEFMGRLTQARCLSAYQDGTALTGKGRWEEAVGKFSESLRIDPNFEEAAEALARAKRQASRTRHERALERADQGKLEEAVTELKRSLELDPENADAKAALESVNPERQAASGQVSLLYEKSASLRGQKRWQKAAEALQAAVAADPNHLPARARLKQCKDALDRAKRSYAEGSRRLAEKDLDQAIAALEQALEIWPFYAEAGQLLSSAQARRRQAEDLFQRAGGSFQAGRWDEAIAKAGSALKIFPSHSGARSLRRQAMLNAAAIRAEAGQRLLDKGKLDEAEREFRRSLAYVSDLPAAKEGIARVCFLRGRAAEKAGLWGNALLWHMEAVESDASPEYSSRLRQARAKLAERVSFALGVDVRSATLKSRLLRRLSADRPSSLSLLGEGAGARPAYTAIVELAELDVRDRAVRTENKVHRYTVARTDRNPRIPQLRKLLLAARQDLARLRRAYERKCPTCKGTGKLTCQSCQGKGTLPCKACGGRGTVKCSHCGGTGHTGGSVCHECRGLGVESCQACHGSGQVHCPVCSTPKQKRGWVACKRCHGTGRLTNVKKSDVDEKQREVQRLTRLLAREPQPITKKVRAEWPYAVVHYEKTGISEVSIQLIRTDTGAIIATPAVRNSARYEDAATRNANPAIGLAEDGLSFPSDQSVRSALLDAAAVESSRRILSAVLEAEISRFRATAKRLSLSGKTDEAVEALVNAAVLTESIDPRAAAKALRDLRAASVGAPTGG